MSRGWTHTNGGVLETEGLQRNQTFNGVHFAQSAVRSCAPTTKRPRNKSFATRRRNRDSSYDSAINPVFNSEDLEERVIDFSRFDKVLSDVHWPGPNTIGIECAI